MFYLGIDQHRKQLTINLRNEAGDVVRRRQVSTRWKSMDAFCAELDELTAGDGGYIAMFEVCGFNDWLLTRLGQHGLCRQTLLVQAETRSKHKTDKRDANRLCELLWINRERLLTGKKVQQLRVVHLPDARDAVARQLTALLVRTTRQRTRTINSIHHLLLKHNLQQDCPTKSIKTKKARAWLSKLELPVVDRLEMNQLLEQWTLWDRQHEQLSQEIHVQQQAHPGAQLLRTLPGCGVFSSLALACRIGDIHRFDRPQSLANFFGLTPGCRNSGDTKQRLGSITKQGSSLVRFVLGQQVLLFMKRKAAFRHWYKQIKNRRGSKIARVALMRRLATIMWHMLHDGKPYRPYGLNPAPTEPTQETLLTSTPDTTPATSARARQKGLARRPL
jgi:transposase